MRPLPRGLPAAEGRGFDPARLSPTAFRERHHQPLGHLSAAKFRGPTRFRRLDLPMQVRRFHYAWVIVAVTLVTLVAAQAVRAAPGVIIVPLEQEFGWDRAAISLAVGLSLLTFGLGGPLGGWLLERFGPRRLLVGGIVLIGLGLFALIRISELWQLYLVWGIVIGLGTGAAGQVASAAIAQRWFRTHRGRIVGLFGGATSAGQLVFVPAMAALTVTMGWRAAIVLLLAAAAIAIVPLRA